MKLFFIHLIQLVQLYSMKRFQKKDIHCNNEKRNGFGLTTVSDLTFQLIAIHRKQILKEEKKNRSTTNYQA